MIGVDIVCGGERLADDVVVCRRTAAVRLSMLCCCLTSILSICTCLVLMTFICFRISDSVLFSKKAGKSEGVCVSFLSVLMAVVEQAKLLLSERVVLVIPEILAKTGTDH